MYLALSVSALLATLVAMLCHYFIFGPRHRDLPREPRDVRRFSLWSVVVHAALVLSFLTLAATGAAAVAQGARLRGWLLLAHWVAAPVFAVGLTLMVLSWAEACRFEPHDIEWAKRAGGYLGGSHHVPAGRFNAGQKAFVWSIGALGAAVTLSGAAMMWPVLGMRAVFLNVHRGASLLLLLALVALAWWLMAAVICLRILKASPGMIIAGLSFSTELRGVRLFLTLLTLVFGAACLGLPLFPGDAGSSLLARAAASPLVRRSFA